MSHQLETIIGYKFKNPKLLETALTHTSYANESRTPVQHNERLEFLGDSVLQIVSADYLFHAYADRPEGDLTRIRSSLVSEGALFQFAQEINLGEYLRLGRGEERCGGRTRPSVVSDAFEAVIAALYLDGGMEVAKSFILPFITEGKHAAEKIAAGASLVQLYSALVYEGPYLAKRINQGLKTLMARDGFATIDQIVGIDA